MAKSTFRKDIKGYKKRWALDLEDVYHGRGFVVFQFKYNYKMMSAKWTLKHILSCPYLVEHDHNYQLVILNKKEE